MNKKTSAIYEMDIIPLGGADIYNQIGSTSIEVSNINRCWRFPVTGGELTEKKTQEGGFIHAVFSGRVTDTSEEMENRLKQAENITAVAIMKYTTGDKKLLGSAATPVFLHREKKGRYAAHELIIESDQPEFAKFIDLL